MGLERIAMVDREEDGPRWPNLADRIRRYLRAGFPEIAGIRWGYPGVEVRTLNPIFELVRHGVWVTGSRIWRQAYNVEVDAAADWDIFCMNQGEHSKILTLLAQIPGPTPKEAQKDKTSLGGDIRYTTRGRVDVWVTGALDATQAIAQYPGSHQHCRVAYNPATKSIIMGATSPHEDIDAGEEYAQAERLALYYTNEAVRLKGLQ